MKLFFLLHFLLLLCFHSSFGGVFDTVFTAEPARHHHLIRHVYRSTILKMDSAAAMGALKELEHRARESQQHDIELFATGYQGIYLLSRPGSDPGHGKRLLIHAMEQCRYYDLPHMRGYFTFFLGYSLYRRNLLDEALVYMFEGADEMAATGYERIPAPELCLFLLGDLYFDFDNYEQAVGYYKEALKYSQRHQLVHLMSINKLAAAQVEMGNHMEALQYFDQGITLADSLHDTACLAILKSNLALLFMELEDYTRAEPLLQFAYEQAVLHQEQTTVLSCLLQLATIDTERKHFAGAMQKAAQAREMLIRPHPFAIEAEVEYYLMKSKLFDAMGFYREASACKDSLRLLRDSIGEKRDANMLANMRAQITAEHHRTDLRVLEKEKEIHRILRNITMAIALTVVLILVGLLYIAWQRQRKARLQYRWEKQEAERKLEAFRSNIQRKNQLIESFRQQLQYQPAAMEAPERDVLHEQLYQATILTEDDWLEFKKIFERVYPDFIAQLQVKHPELTVAEIRLLTLLKLNLSTSEIAGMLGILPQSVRKTRSRLMKKLDVSDHKKLPSFIEDI